MLISTCFVDFLNPVLPPKSFQNTTEAPAKHPHPHPQTPKKENRLTKSKNGMFNRSLGIFTIRNRDRLVFFFDFLIWVKELVNSDCRFGFLMQSFAYMYKAGHAKSLIALVRKEQIPSSHTDECYRSSYVSPV